MSVQLEENLELLEKSLAALNYSYTKCSRIGEKCNYDLEEQECFEALASRYARTSDILTQKVLKTFFLLMQEDIKSNIDGANFLEKIGVIENADELLEIRELRNQIAHEYVEVELASLFSEILSHVPKLMLMVNDVKQFIIEKTPFIS